MKRNLLVAASFAFLSSIAFSQTVTSFAGKVNPDPLNNYSNTTANLADAYFNLPEGITWDKSGNMYVTGNNKIRLITNGKVYNRSGKTGDPTFTLGYANGTGNAAAYYQPTSIVCASNGDAYIVDAGNHAIRKLTAYVNAGNGQIASTFAGGNPSGGFGQAGYKDGPATSARFNEPKGITMDGSGNMYVTDFGNHCIRKVSPTGQVLTLAGKGEDYGNVDGTTAARFDSPYGIAMLDGSHVVVTDFRNTSIRKININSGEVTTICGGLGYKDGSLSEARFRSPRGIAVVNGLIYVADGTCIRVIDEKNKTVSTFAGSGSASGNTNGTGTDARFGAVFGLSYDGGSNLYVTDVVSHIVKKVSIDDLAPKADFSITKENIAINEETTLTDISSGKEATIRKWTVENTSGSSSNVVLVQGDYNSSKSITIKFNATGSYRVTLEVTNEFGNDQVTKTNITVSTVGVADIQKSNAISIYPNPSNGETVNIDLGDASFENTSVQLRTINGSILSNETVLSGNHYHLNTAGLTSGVYFITLQDKTGVISKKLVVQ
mgnify:CR=1 FL=1